MKRRIYNLARLFVLLAMFAQAIVPTRSFADVSVRCAGAASASMPCMHAVLPVAAGSASQTRCAQMSCCRSAASLMRACNMSSSGTAASPNVQAMQMGHGKTTCLISVKPLAVSQPVAVRSSYRWLLGAAPAAPPIETPFVAAPIASGVTLFRAHFHLPRPRLLVRAHGLRAPPAA